MDIQPSFKADSQFAKASKPSVRPLHHPPVQPCVAVNASSGNAAGDTPSSQVRTATLVVIALAGAQLRWSFAGVPWQACNRRNSVHAPLEHLGVVTVCAADQDHQRDASGIYNDLSFGAELAYVRRVGPRFLAPRGLGTEEPSMLPRHQSIWSCLRKRAAWPGATVPKQQRRSSPAGAASRSCRCRTQEIGEGLPMECLFAARTRCR